MDLKNVLDRLQTNQPVRVADLVDVVGLDADNPRFLWVLEKILEPTGMVVSDLCKKMRIIPHQEAYRLMKIYFEQTCPLIEEFFKICSEKNQNYISSRYEKMQDYINGYLHTKMTISRFVDIFRVRESLAGINQNLVSSLLENILSILPLETILFEYEENCLASSRKIRTRFDAAFRERCQKRLEKKLKKELSSQKTDDEQSQKRYEHLYEISPFVKEDAATFVDNFANGRITTYVKVSQNLLDEIAKSSELTATFKATFRNNKLSEKLLFTENCFPSFEEGKLYNVINDEIDMAKSGFISQENYTQSIMENLLNQPDDVILEFLSSDEENSEISEFSSESDEENDDNDEIEEEIKSYMMEDEEDENDISEEEEIDDNVITSIPFSPTPILNFMIPSEQPPAQSV